MKKVLLLLLIICLFTKSLLAQDGCAVRPDAPNVLSVTAPVCGSTSEIVGLDQPFDDIEYTIFADGSTQGTIYTGSQVSLPVGHSYTIYATDASTGCSSLQGTPITVDPAPLFLPAPTISVELPACGANTGTISVTDPLGANYEYSNSGGVSYQSGPTFTAAAGIAYGITVHNITTGCISVPAAGTMSPSWPSSQSILYVNANATGNNNGTSWADAFKNLQDALANSGGCVTQIWVAKGTYYPDHGGGKTAGDRTAAFVMRNNLAIYGGFAGTESSLTDRNWKVNKTIVSGDIDDVPDVVSADGSTITGNDGNSNNVIWNTNLDNTAIIDGFVITGGNSSSLGGGMYNSNSSPSVTNCIFMANHANQYGGGMANIALSSPLVANCIFMTNSAGESGGAMANGFAIDPGNGAPVVTNCSFVGNYSADGSAIWNQGGNATIANCIFWGNLGGGVVIDGFSGVIVTSYSIVQGGYAGTGNLDIDPLFVDAANGDLHLQACSPAIDAGSNAVVPAGVTTDLDGNIRIFNASNKSSAIVDMGAYEYNGTVPIFYRDADGDGYGDPNVSTTVCPAPAGYVSNNTDCDDSKAAINPATVWYKDADNDGYSDGTTQTQCTRPTNYKLASELIATSGDCDDADATINPATVWYKDADNDGYSDGTTQTQCTQPTNYKLASELIATSGDCDDGDASVNPSLVWYKDADNDGYSDGSTLQQCTRPANYKLASELIATSGDCDDNNATVWQSATLYIDKDGDGYDAGTARVCYGATTPAGYSISTSGSDCNDNDANVHTSPNINVPSATSTCSGGKATITASSSALNPTYSWYADAAGQNLLLQGTSASFTTPVLTANAIYYVSVADGAASCASALTPASVTVNPLPVVAAITYNGSTTACNGSTVTLSDATPGGTWTTSSNAASVSTTGVVNFATVSAATNVTIYYTVTSNDCSQTVGILFTVNTSLSVKAITGSTTICGVGATTTLSDATGGGTWSSNNTAVATVNSSTGVVTGKSAGSAMITYTVSSGSCSASASTTVSVSALPAVAAISGTSVLIRGTSFTLTDATKGGTWSSSNTAIATVSTSGSVKGISAGTCTIYYTITSGGCSAAASKSVTVYNPLSASVTSGKILCNGGSTTLTINVTGGSGGYQYSLNAGKFQTSNTYSVYAGTYFVVVKDNMAEQFTISGIIIGQPAALGLKLTSETNASSKTASNGSLTVSGSGGTSSYQYSKNSGSTYQASGTFSSLAPGTYQVSIKDANNCVALNKLSVTVGYGNYLSLNTVAEPQISNSDEIVATVSPNPTETEFTLTLGGNSNKQVELRVIDMYGRSVYHTTGSANQSYKFGERFTGGVYIVEILQGKLVKNLKIVKAK